MKDGQGREVDWTRFGLGSEDSTRQRLENGEYGADGHQAQGPNELFAGEGNSSPWWKSQFFISEPILFGTIDGVFTSCLINVFGVIVFLRSGWIVAQAGVLYALLMVFSTVGIALITVLSAVGICERSRMESGGVYFLVAHVLGSRIGTAFGLLYVFGQAVGCSLFVLGLGESLAGLVGVEGNPAAQKGFAAAAVILLCAINVAGVKWVVKVQFGLLVILLLAALDFAVGSFISETGEGFNGWSMQSLNENLYPKYFDNYTLFTVFGVFFPTITGILAGINMSGDLRHPSKDIPNGTLAAIATTTGLYLLFVVTLGCTCDRNVLQTNFMIASKVSAVSVLLLAGLYVSSMSSCLGAMYGTPRVLQSIANENVIPFLSPLGKGRGPNRVPVYALALVACTTVAFIMVGNINTLAPVVTMPYLAMYTIIDYAYFALAMTFDLQLQREHRFRREPSSTSSPAHHQNDNCDLDFLFPERSQHRMYSTVGQSNTPSPEQRPAQQGLQGVVLHKKTANWYSSLCNRWLSLCGAVMKITLMFLVHWKFALANLGAAFIIWLYVGLTNPAVKPGAAADFQFFHWLRRGVLRLCGKKGSEYEEIVVPPTLSGVEMFPAQQNDENEDFSNRQRFHQSATVLPASRSDPAASPANIQCFEVPTAALIPK